MPQESTPAKVSPPAKYSRLLAKGSVMSALVGLKDLKRKPEDEVEEEAEEQLEAARGLRCACQM